MESLSVIILNYNTFELTCNCIRSILHSRPPAFELQIVLVDNGSTEEHEASFLELFPDITYVRSVENLGFARGNNLGLQHATKSYVLLLNSDTLIVDGQVLVESIRILKEHEDRIILTTKLLTADGKSQVAYGYIPRVGLELMLTLFIHKIIPRRAQQELLISFVPDESRLIRNGYITATYYCFARKALALLPAGKLYDKTFLYGEELFWATQWMSVGMKMYYSSELSIVHFIGMSSKTKRNYTATMRRVYQVKAEHEFLKWRYGPIELTLIYCLRIIRFLVLAPFDKGIRVRLKVLLRVIFNKS